MKSLQLALLLLSACEHTELAPAACPLVTVGEPQALLQGEVGQDLTHDFVVRNVGNEAVVIVDVVTSCGCTAAEPRVSLLESGEQTVIAVTVELSKPGERRETVYVKWTTTSAEGVLPLAVSTEVSYEGYLWAAPAYLRLASAAEAFTVVARSQLTVCPRTGVGFPELSIEAPVDLNVDLVQELASYELCRRYALLARPTAAAAFGDSQPRVRISARFSDGRSEVIELAVVPEADPHPKSLFLGTGLCDSVEQIMPLYDDSVPTVIATTTPALEVAYLGDEHALRVVFVAGRYQGPSWLREEISLMSGGHAVTIPVYGTLAEGSR